jgi:hypothetical protein
MDNFKDFVLEKNPNVPFDIKCPRNKDLSLDETVCKSYMSSQNHMIVCSDGTIINWDKRIPGKCRMYQELLLLSKRKSLF